MAESTTLKSIQPDTWGKASDDSTIERWLLAQFGNP
jgi:hypothetical protein